jgi:MFS family permease
VGRKTTLVVALSTMGLSTVAIGALPTYHTIGFTAPLLLALCRFGQGLGLGGEWGGAVLLAIENAPPNKRAWYGMFPQLGAPAGFFFSGGVFLLLSRWLTDQQFFAFGWRIPFLASAVLVFLGLYVRLTITETPVFEEARKRGEQVRLPMVSVFRSYTRPLIAGTFLSLATFVLFYLMTVFALSWGTNALGYGRGKFLLMQLFCLSFFALTIPLSAILAERGRRRAMLLVTVAIGGVRPNHGAFICLRHDRRAGDDGGGSFPDGLYVRPARHRHFRIVSDAGALHRQFAGVQFRGHSGRFSRAVYCDLAGEELWIAVRGLLSHRSRRLDAAWATFDP